jgi:hypothetical protein
MRWEHELDLSGSEQEQVAGSCECSNERYGKLWEISWLDGDRLTCQWLFNNANNNSTIVTFQTFAVVHIFAVFFFLGDYPASCFKI